MSITVGFPMGYTGSIDEILIYEMSQEQILYLPYTSNTAAFLAHLWAAKTSHPGEVPPRESDRALGSHGPRSVFSIEV
jgi:hypothetical protein